MGNAHPTRETPEVAPLEFFIGRLADHPSEPGLYFIFPWQFTQIWGSIFVHFINSQKA